jgi:hypothetical protein
MADRQTLLDLKYRPRSSGKVSSRNLEAWAGNHKATFGHFLLRQLQTMVEVQEGWID